MNGVLLLAEIYKICIWEDLAHFCATPKLEIHQMFGNVCSKTSSKSSILNQIRPFSGPIFVGCRKETNDEKGNNCKQYDTSFKYGLTLKYEKRASEKITRTRKVCEKDRRLSAACFIVYIPYREKQSILPSELQFADSCAAILGSSETAPWARWLVYVCAIRWR